MSKIPNYIRNHGQAGLRGCRVAYAINESQPVICTIISDQPLFYMDFGVEDALEDHFDELFTIRDIEAGISAIHNKIENGADIEEFGHIGEQGGERLEKFSVDLSACVSPGNSGQPCRDIAGLIDILEKSRLAKAYYNNLRQRGGAIQYNAQVTDAYYDRDSLNIYIPATLSLEEQALLAARELRRAWQHSAGALIHPLSFHPDQAVLVNRVQIADLDANMIRIAWELQLSGNTGPWERIEKSNMTDLARALVRECYIDFRTLNNGLACSALFETWFLSERCRHADSELIQLMLADFKGMVFDCSRSSQTVTAELVIALGSMPFGKNYLAPYAATIISDPVFTELRDRSNANFLWFIKFERSFRESEQGLQEDGSHRDDLHEIIRNKQDKERFGDHEKEAPITTIYGESPEDGELPRKKSSNVISLSERRSDH